MDPDDLYIGPTVLAPGVDDRGDRLARKVLIPLALVLLLIVGTFYVFFSVIVVAGDSMVPTLLPADVLLVTRSYATPRRGDVVVFRTMDGTEMQQDLIKRVAAVEGDTVSVDNGIATINGVVEDVTNRTVSAQDGTVVDETVVPAGFVFVLGDNRPIALDSRDFGSIPLTAIRGKAVIRFAPIQRASRVR